MRWDFLLSSTGCYLSNIFSISSQRAKAGRKTTKTRVWHLTWPHMQSYDTQQRSLTRICYVLNYKVTWRAILKPWAQGYLLTLSPQKHLETQLMTVSCLWGQNKDLWAWGNFEPNADVNQFSQLSTATMLKCNSTEMKHNKFYTRFIYSRTLGVVSLS